MSCKAPKMTDTKVPVPEGIRPNVKKTKVEVSSKKPEVSNVIALHDERHYCTVSRMMSVSGYFGNW